MMMPSGNTRAALGGFLLLFVASRLLYLVLIDPARLVVWGGEELYRGTIAQELVTGVKMPFIEYRADNYAGGSLVIGALAAGFFLLIGPTLFVLKLAPLLRSEEHTSELQSRLHLVCRLLLEKKKPKNTPNRSSAKCSWSMQP